MGRKVSEGAWDRWRARLERFEASDWTVERFCRLERVSTASFYQWRRKLSGERPQDKPRFVPVLLPEPRESSASVLVTLANGTRIEVPGGDRELVARIVELLARPAGGGA